MRGLSRSALVPYSPGEMFALVDGIERYPEFLPWCSGSEVHERAEEQVRASIELSRAGISKSFTTLNQNVLAESIHVSLVSGPFRKLDGSWLFHTLGESACKVEFKVNFEFSSALLARVFGPVFEDTVNSLVDAFVRRAEVVYGKRL